MIPMNADFDFGQFHRVPMPLPSMDGKFVAIARERKIPFSYLHGVNMEQIIRQIYESGK